MTTDLAKRLPDGIDIANKLEVITLGKALKAAVLAGMSKESIEALPRQEIVGKFIRQHNAKEVSSAMLKHNADYCSRMIQICEDEITRIDTNRKDVPLTDEQEERKLKWVKAMSLYTSQHHYNARALERAMGRELTEAEAASPRTPSFPPNVNVQAPVMAQQVNVVVHQHKED